MKEMKNFFNFFKDENGQAVVDYVLTLTVVVTIVGIIATGFRRSLFKIWEIFSKEISAACPGCPPDPGVNIR